MSAATSGVGTCHVAGRSIMMSTVDGPGATVPTLSLEDLYRRESRRLLGMLCVFLGDRSEAEDVLQESFVRVQRSWDRIDDLDRADAYLRSIAFNLARSSWRRRRQRPDRVGIDPIDRERSSTLVAVDMVGDGLTLREDQRAVLNALRDLPTRQRACVVLRFYAGAGIDEIASTLGITANSVKTHLKRGLAHLRKELEGTR